MVFVQLWCHVRRYGPITFTFTSIQQLDYHVDVLLLNDLFSGVCDGAGVVTMRTIGGVAAGVYETNGRSACQHILRTSDCEVVVCDSSEKLKKFLPTEEKEKEEAESYSGVKLYVCWEAGFTSRPESNTLSWNDFLKLGDEDPELENVSSNQKQSHISTHPHIHIYYIQSV
jgi:long-subunit acyl-CoA synthetase (AMP-forming)